MNSTVTRSTWTDERLDDLSERVDRGFDRVDADVRELRSEMNSRFDGVDARFRSLEKLMFGTLATIVAGFLATGLSIALTNS